MFSSAGDFLSDQVTPLPTQENICGGGNCVNKTIERQEAGIIEASRHWINTVVSHSEKKKQQQKAFGTATSGDCMFTFMSMIHFLLKIFEISYLSSYFYFLAVCIFSFFKY